LTALCASLDPPKVHWIAVAMKTRGLKALGQGRRSYARKGEANAKSP
jgi:hypothetical protein